MSAITRAVDRVYAMRIMSILNKEFVDWPAYKLGIIDVNGNLIKTAKSADEKNAYTRLDAVLRPVKVALNKFPGGVSALARAYLMKGFLYESKSEILFPAIVEAGRAYDHHDDDIDPYIIAIVTESLVGLWPEDDFITTMMEEMVSGDAGGDAKKIAAGENSGAIMYKAPQVLNKKKKVDKKPVE